MTLPRRHTRRLIVRGRAFRWTCAARAEPEFGFVVEEEATKGALLRIYLGEGCDVVPRLVAACIESALDAGWAPNRPGPPFQMDWSTGL